MNKLISSFNSGELSPRLESRSDIEKYSSGCRLLQNFLVTPYGGVNRRPGLDYLGVAKKSGQKSRLIGFNFSTNTAFILEFGELYCRFWKDGEPVIKDGSPLEIETSYTAEEVFELQYTQINDIVIVVHPLYPQQTISRYADDDWRVAETSWDWPAVLDENTGNTTLTPTATNGTISINASASLFKPGHVGGTWQVVQRRAITSIELSLSSSSTSSGIGVYGKWDLTTHGTWSGWLWIERSKDGGVSWEILRYFVAYSDRNIAVDGEELEECLIRLRYVFSSYSGTTLPVAYFEAYDSERNGTFKITEYISETQVVAMVGKAFESTDPIKRWSEGAWSPYRGYPRSVCLHQQRLVFGGTSSKPQTIWTSATEDFYNFKLGTNDDEAMSFTLASAETNPIQWMVSQQYLCIGTAADEFILYPPSDGALSPTNFQVKRQSHFGSCYLQAMVANDAVLFVQRQGLKVREFSYDYQKDGYSAADLTALAEHISQGGVIQTAFQQQTDAVFWCVTGNGVLIGMTYERSQNVVGWCRIVTDGAFESVASIYSANGADEIWCVVRRTINSSDVRTIERFDIGFRDELESEDKSKWQYLDCAKRFTFEAETTEISGLDHLEGKTVSILADGAVQPDQTVSDGAITLQYAARNVLVGLGYASQLIPMPLDPGQLQTGTAQGMKFRINRAVLRVYKSLGGEVETSPGQWDPVCYRSSEDRMDDSPPVFTGDKEVALARNFEQKATINVRQIQPLPLTLLAIIPKYEISGD